MENILKYLERTFENVRVTRVQCNSNGVVTAEAVQKAIVPGHTILVSVMLANNESGALQPVADIGKLCRHHNILLHTDASQALGKIDVDARALGADLLTITGHKFHAPKGSGAIYIRNAVKSLLSPIAFGAAHGKMANNCKHFSSLF